MTSIGVAGPRLTWIRLNRLAWRALLPAWLSLCGASAGFAAEALRFDGTQDTVEVSSAQRFTAGDLERLTLDVAIGRIKGPAATLFMLSGGATVFMASFDATTGHVTLNSAPRPDPRAIGPKLAPAEPFRLVLSRAPTGWQVSINDSASEAVGAEELDPARPAQLDLALGEVGLVGTVQSLTVALKGGETLVLQGDGVLKPGQGGVATAAGPRLGLYRRSDAVKEYGASGTSEIVRPSFRYFALVEREGALGLVFDWGGFLPLVPDATAPGRYVPADPRFAWAGAITFDPSNDGYFTASDVSESYRPAEPLLTNGARYHHIVSSAEKPYPKAAPGEVQLGSVFAQHAPSNFYFSIDACYDLLRMDRSDFTRTGCNAPLFAMPPKTSAGFRPGGEPGQIIPFGWSYEVFSHVYGTEFTSLVESASEVTDALSNMQGSDWKGSLAGLTIESSQSSIQSDQARQLLQNSHMGKIQQSIGTSHTIVLEPGEVLLHHCFIKRVMRMAPGAKPPSYYRNEAEFDSAEDLTAAVDRSIGRKDDCPEDVKQPLTVEAFLGLYGTHYAHSITYGGWGRNVTTYSRRSIETQLVESTEFKQALHIGFEKTGAKEDPLTGSGVKGGRTSDERSEGSTRQQSGSEITTTGWHCVGGAGGNCEHGIERNSLLVPVFLDLRLLDGLLGPPFFTDPAVSRRPATPGAGGHSRETERRDENPSGRAPGPAGLQASMSKRSAAAATQEPATTSCRSAIWSSTERREMAATST